MSRIFITGSTDGLGLAAARTLMDEGHQVVLHARSSKRASALTDLAPRSAGVLIGDLSSAVETRALAEQVNKIGRMDAVIHNANRAYSESKLYLTALAMAVARRWSDVLSNAVDPGWVPTKMGGPGAPDDLTQGHLTQTWLAVSNDPAAKVSGGYWHHRKQQQPESEARDPGFQDRLIAKLAELTGISLF